MVVPERLTLTGTASATFMKEKAQAALSICVRNAKRSIFPEAFTKAKEIHYSSSRRIAIPKDGPSAASPWRSRCIRDKRANPLAAIWQ